MTAKLAMGENKGQGPVEDLLPGILDDIVFGKIIPKLEWKDFYVLSSVSCAWHDAIISRRVFDSRVLSHSVETFVRVGVVGYTRTTIALYSMRDNSWHKLPRIAGISEGQDRIPSLAQCVSMDGKNYVLGGVIDCEVSNKVFVFDLAGQGRWEQCASMKQRRQGFGSAVMKGKIYVFGGLNAGSSLRSAEVYEPKEDTWSPIRPMATCRNDQHVTPIGEELFIYGGFSIGSFATLARSLEAYHPFKDEWRVVHRSWNPPRCDFLFDVRGTIFSIETDFDYTRNHLGKSLVMSKYDVHGNSWTRVSRYSVAARIPVEYDSLWSYATPDAVLVVDDELIALVSCLERKGAGPWGLCQFRITGLGSGKNMTSWELRGNFEPVAEGAQLIEGADYYFVQKL